MLNALLISDIDSSQLGDFGHMIRENHAGVNHYLSGSQEGRVRNLKFGTYLKFATCENTNKINEL